MVGFFKASEQDWIEMNGWRLNQAISKKNLMAKKMLQIEIMISHDLNRVRDWNFVGMIIIVCLHPHGGWLKFLDRKIWVFFNLSLVASSLG